MFFTCMLHSESETQYKRSDAGLEFEEEFTMYGEANMNGENLSCLNLVRYLCMHICLYKAEANNVTVIL